MLTTQDSDKEVQILHAMQQLEKPGFPEIISEGKVNEKLSYIIMRKYGVSIKTLLRKARAKRFSLKTST